MKKAIASAVVALGLLAAASAEAGWFHGSDKLPRAIDSPIVRPKVQEGHKVFHNMKSRLKQDERPEWGAQWNQIFKYPEVRPTGHYNR